MFVVHWVIFSGKICILDPSSFLSIILYTFVLKGSCFFSSYIVAVIAYTTRRGDKNGPISFPEKCLR